ncbi:MAG TPA: hypothetical protein VK179_20625 [Bacteroidales bacterium]|nr:hypothetical protein [Bacteroidales bacterium]
MASSSKNPKSKAGNQADKKGNPQPKVQPVKSKIPAVKSDMWTTLDKFFVKHLNAVLVLSVLLSAFMGAFLFDVKISTGGDDSHYIEMANEFLKGRAFPSWHGPLYSIFLSVPIMIFGVNVIWLKIFSFLFMIAHLVLFYYTFRRHVSATLFTLIMLVLAVNASLLYFASQTYSEAMFMFLQSLSIFIFLNIYQNVNLDEKLPLKHEALQWLILGFFVFLVSLTRNIGIVMLLAMVLFLVWEKKFRGAVMLVISFLIFLFPFRIYKTLAWHEKLSQGPDQISEILRKNPYNRALGTEDFAGMVDRFILNAKSYLSRHFMIGLGLHDPASPDKSGFVTLVIVILFLVATYFAFRRSKIMLFLAIYLGGAITATFIALHQSWDQMRMVVIFIPLLLLMLAWGIQQISINRRYTYLGIVLMIFLVVVFVRTFDQTSERMKVNRKFLSRNIKGNLYYGFTPDWQNFLKMSEWVSKNIPADKVVASRKPSMSYIYGKGREFYGMYRFPSEEPVQFIQKLEKRTGNLLVLPNKLVDTHWPAQLQWGIKRANVGCVAEGSELYGVYDFKSNEGNEIIQSLYKNKVIPFSVDSLIKRVNVSKQNCFAVSPDSLLNTLRKNKVEYIIVASLRANPNANTGNIINNIQRYLFFVEQKYPGILELVHQVGNSDAEEPTWLYKINYKFYGL